MKKAIAVFLCLATLIPLCACSAGLTETPSETDETEKPAVTKKEEKAVSVSDPLTWDKINAIPIATSDMTEDQLRQICVDYFRLQLTYQWTPSDSFRYEIEAYDRMVDMKKGKIYS